MDVTSQTLIFLNVEGSVILPYNTLCPFHDEFGSPNKHFDTENSLHRDHSEIPVLGTLEVSAVLIKTQVVTIIFLALEQVPLHLS